MARTEAIELANAIITAVDHGKLQLFGDKDKTFADVCRALLAEVGRTTLLRRMLDNVSCEINAIANGDSDERASHWKVTKMDMPELFGEAASSGSAMYMSDAVQMVLDMTGDKEQP